MTNLVAMPKSALKNSTKSPTTVPKSALASKDMAHGASKNGARFLPLDQTDQKNINQLMKASKSTLAKTAESIVDDKVKESRIFDATVEDRVPRFTKEELTLGRVLGRGGFCMAVEIERVKIVGGPKRSGSSIASSAFFSMFRKNDSTRDLSHKESVVDDASEAPSVVADQDRSGKQSAFSMPLDYLSRDKIANLARRRNRKGGLFVLKRILPDLDNFSFLKGVVDLSMEAKFLAALDHPNIIKLCGMSTKGPAHFIIVERLQETLSTRFKLWSKIDRQCNGITGAFAGSKRKELDLYETRLGVAYSMASALAYLHDHGVVFRDLKPDNCGFDRDDRFKLFDFGLAKELLDHDKVGEDLYKLTGMTGAMRYMAPEVGLGKPYNKAADVYSWAMCFWFILALEPPFGFYSEDMIRDRVFKRGSRPAIFNSWSDSLSGVLKLAWGVDIAARPTFHDICVVLTKELHGSVA